MINWRKENTNLILLERWSFKDEIRKINKTVLVCLFCVKRCSKSYTEVYVLFVFGTSILAMRVFLTSFSWELMASTWKYIFEYITEAWITLESIWRTVLLTVSSSGIKARAMESTAAAPPKYWRNLPNFRYLLGKIYFWKSYFRALPEPLKLLLSKFDFVGRMIWAQYPFGASLNTLIS